MILSKNGEVALIESHECRTTGLHAFSLEEACRLYGVLSTYTWEQYFFVKEKFPYGQDRFFLFIEIKPQLVFTSKQEFGALQILAETFRGKPDEVINHWHLHESEQIEEFGECRMFEYRKKEYEE